MNQSFSLREGLPRLPFLRANFFYVRHNYFPFVSNQELRYNFFLKLLQKSWCTIFCLFTFLYVLLKEYRHALYFSVYASIKLSILFIFLSIYLLYMSVYLPIHVSICLSIYSICLSICLSIGLSVYLSILYFCLSIYIWPYMSFYLF